MVPYIIGGVVLAVLIAIIAYYVARFMKGSVKLPLARNSAASGEPISGRVDLEAKRSIHGLLKVSLVGREKREKRSSNGDGTTTEWVDVYRADRILEETRDFGGGFTQTYEFETVAPTSAEARRGGAVIREMADKAGDGVMGSVMKMAAGAADMMQGRIYWHMEARLDADGVDLYTKEKVTVNLRD